MWFFQPFFCFLQPAFGHGRLGHPQSLEYYKKKLVKCKRLREKERKREERLSDSNNNGQLRIANATSGGACKAAWAKILPFLAQPTDFSHRAEFGNWLAKEYSRDCGSPRRPWPNAGCKKQKNGRKSAFFVKKIKITKFLFAYIF